VFEYLNKIIFGKNPFIPLERRLLLLLLFAGILLGVVGSSINVILGMPPALLLAGYGISLLIFLLFRRVIRSGEIHDYSLVMFVAIIVFFPIQYLLNGGRDSANATFAFILLVLMYFVLSPFYAKLSFVILVGEFIILSFLEHLFPQIVTPYSDVTQRFVDVLVGNLLYFFMLVFTLSIIKNAYDFQIRKGELQNEELKKT